MAKRSAGILLYRGHGDHLEVFLVHPGGPFWVNKDAGAWTIPKGEYDPDEAALDAARREFTEETGFTANPPFEDLGEIRQSSGKTVTAFASRGDCDPANLKSNLCQVEWPPRSRKLIDIPEVDRGAWYSLHDAHSKIFTAQKPLLDRLARLFKASE